MDSHDSELRGDPDVPNTETCAPATRADLSALRRDTEQILGDRRVNGYVIIPRDVVWRLLDAAQAAEAECVRLSAYVQHKSECASRNIVAFKETAFGSVMEFIDKLPACTCGLERKNTPV